MKTLLSERKNRDNLLGLVLVLTGIYALWIGDTQQGHFFILLSAIIVK